MTDDVNRPPLRLLISACRSLAIFAAALLGPAGALSAASASVSPSSGGAGIDGVGPSAPATSAAPGTAAALQVSGLLSVSGSGITLKSPRIARLNGTVRFTGTAAQANAGETVVIQRQSSLPGEWVNAASATVGAGGTFVASWHVNQSGSLSVRAALSSSVGNVASARSAVLGGGRTAAQAITMAATPTLTLTVYRGAVATIYGPGFYGHRTACGEQLKRATLGVANRTLPCGTMVAIYYQGRELVVPVIDRGPYAHHASWDLTFATAKVLGITETARIGTLSPPPTA